MNLRKIIKDNIEETVYEKEFINIISELDKTVRFLKMADYNLLKILPESKKPIFVSRRQKAYMKYFHDDELIMESYNNHFKSNLLLENERNYKSEIQDFYEFLKYSVLHGSGLLNEETWNPFNKDFWSVENAKKIGGQAYEAGKTAVKYGTPIGWAYQAGKYGYQKATQAIDYIKKQGVTAIFEKIRELLFNGYYNALEVVLGWALPGWGQVLTSIPWIVMTIYDGFQYFVNNVGGSIINFVIDVIMMVMGLIGAKSAVKASGLKDVAKQGVEVAAKEAGKPGFWGKILAWLIEKVPALQPVINGVKSVAGWFVSQIQKYVVPFIETLSMDWLKKAFEPIIKALKEFAEAKLGTLVQKGGSLVSKGLLALGQKMSKTEFFKRMGGSIVRKLSDEGFKQYLKKNGVKHSVNFASDYGFKKFENAVYDTAEFGLEDLHQILDRSFGGNASPIIHDVFGYLLQYQRVISSVNDWKKAKTGAEGKARQLTKSSFLDGGDKLKSRTETLGQSVEKGQPGMYQGRTTYTRGLYEPTKDLFRRGTGLEKTYGNPSF